MADIYSKLAWAITVSNKSAPHVATSTLEKWIISYGIPNTTMTDIGPQFVLKFFATLCASMSIELATATEYQP